ncbi:chitin synthase [Plasmodiophora brassicae]
MCVRAATWAPVASVGNVASTHCSRLYLNTIGQPLIGNSLGKSGCGGTRKGVPRGRLHLKSRPPHIITYVVTLGNVVFHGEENQDHPVLTRLVAAIFLVLYTSYNFGVYGLLFVSLNFGHAFCSWASP